MSRCIPAACSSVALDGQSTQADATRRSPPAQLRSGAAAAFDVVILLFLLTLSEVDVALVQDDVLVRALRFLDNLLQRDNLQKAAFLKVTAL